MKMCKY